MRKKTNEKSLDNTNYFKEYRKTEIGKRNFWLFIIGFIAFMIGVAIQGAIIGDTIAIMDMSCTNHPQTHLSLLFEVFLLIVFAGLLMGIFVGQVMHYSYTKKKAK